MLIMDTDSALRQKSESSEEKLKDKNRHDGHLFLAREPAEDSSAQVTRPARRRPGARPLNNGVGWIQVIRPSSETNLAPRATAEPMALPMPHDEMAAARGVMTGVALGLVFWIGIAGAIALVLF